MTNPYKVLDLPQNATAAQIVKAQIVAMRKRIYTQKEIAEAQTTLRKPSSRLAADFTFPIINTEKISPLTSRIKSKEVNWENLDTEKYNSFKL